VEFLKKELLKKGVRPSIQRIKVLEYLYKKEGHPTVDDIFEALSPDIPSLSKTTVYNTLHSFVNTGLARVISIDGVEMRYDIILYNHGHFRCERCGTIFNFKINLDSVPFDDLAQFEIKEKNVYFTGLCPNCLNPRKEEKE
jgi:Fur family peroxide stress response transcriptional regulator